VLTVRIVVGTLGADRSDSSASWPYPSDSMASNGVLLSLSWPPRGRNSVPNPADAIVTADYALAKNLPNKFGDGIQSPPLPLYQGSTTNFRMKDYTDFVVDYYAMASGKLNLSQPRLGAKL
jgi:hypothetical protein